MPRFPDLADRTHHLPAGSFTSFGARLHQERQRGTLVPLHIGDTYRMPPPEAVAVDYSGPAIHRYTQVIGAPALRQAVADQLLPALAIERPPDRVVISTGATGGLHLVASALCDPDDEVLVLTPSWPLILGILPAVGARPVGVPVGDTGWPDSPEELAARVEAAIGPRTVALYFSDPNNPVGYVLSTEHRRALAEVARRRDLWLIHDAVYAQLHWAPEPVAWAELAPSDRLITVGSMSKSFALAGHRVGFVVGPESLDRPLRRLITHVCYHAPTGGQAMALAALGSPGYAARMRDRYRGAAEITCRHLRARFAPPQGGAFVFVDLRQLGRPAEEILLLCLDRHVALAPGTGFGDGFEGFARLCYTAVPPEALREALDRLNQVLAPGS